MADLRIPFGFYCGYFDKVVVLFNSPWVEEGGIYECQFGVGFFCMFTRVYSVYLCVCASDKGGSPLLLFSPLIIYDS